MIEQLRNELEIDALVKFKNGRTLYGIILDYFKGESEIENMKFVPNHFLENYRITENPQFVIILDKNLVQAVDVCLK